MSSWRLFLLWLVLLDVRPTLTAVIVYKKPKGEDLTFDCQSDLDLIVTRRVFCNNDCEEDDVLVQTSGNKATNGRFSLEHEKKGSPPVDFITVKISNLSLSDSGRYRCFWDSPVRETFYEFKIDVIDGLEQSTSVISVAAGEDFSYTYAFSKPVKKKTFCRNNCSDDDILVETTGDVGKSGRYRIVHKKQGDDLSYIYVTIRHVSVADSGVYYVKLDGNSYKIWIEVTPAPPGGDPVTVPPSAAPPGGVPVTVSPSAAPPGGVPVTVRPSTVAPEQEPTGSSGGAPETQNLVLILVLVCENVFITGTIVIICYRRRSGRRSGAGGRHNPEREYENVRPESERIYEDLRLEEMEPTYSVLPGGVA